MSYAIVADENIPAVEQYLGALGPVDRVNGRTLAPAHLAHADILLVRSVTRVDAALLEGTPVRFVGTATSGVDHIDQDYLARRGIAFAHAPGANANSVVEYVLAAVAAIGNTLETLLAGGRVGIVGYGSIGRALASRLEALEIGIRVYDPWLDLSIVASAADLDTVLDCDVVSLHAQLCMQQPWPSRHLVGRDELRRLRSGALLINASRGAVVDNAALLAQLQSTGGPITVLDVWEGEPDIDPALLAQVALGTAHIAGYSLDGKLLATRMLGDAAMAWLGDASFSGGTASGTGIAQPLPPLRAPRDLTGAALARHLLLSRYDIRLDDALLRRAIANQGYTPGKSAPFDQLRSAYRDRRELALSVVEGVSPAQVALVRALGCRPIVQGVHD